MHVSRYRSDGVVVIVVNTVVHLAAPQPGLSLRLHFPRSFCGQERQYPSKRQLLSCIVVKKQTRFGIKNRGFAIATRRDQFYGQIQAGIIYRARNVITLTLTQMLLIAERSNEIILELNLVF
ncbi:hypothetical protein PUN28_007280 [Cardiocondyla obscurior]|uniref:Uncharacterized protein n=1 Tax=Cardiocondyla obscurior TaxID=286306 RepID=A0AAW2G325_9HYME